MYKEINKLINEPSKLEHKVCDNLLSLSFRTLFSIDPKKGDIKLNGSTELYTESYYSFLAIANDETSTPRTGKALVKITFTTTSEFGAGHLKRYQR